MLSDLSDSLRCWLPGESPEPCHRTLCSFAMTHPKYPLPSVSPPSDTMNKLWPRSRHNRNVVKASLFSTHSWSKCCSHGSVLLLR